jgi:hypothetical protein
MNTNSTLQKAVCFALVVLTLAGVGCSNPWKTPKMFSLDNTWPFRDKDAPQEGVPVRMVGMWTDTVYTQAGQKPQRGFGGRIMFYEKAEKNPIIVDGQLVVYAFDETKRDPADNKPTRRYVFPADQMPVHMSKSEMGTSYSFWLPWDEAGGPKTEVSLICRFEPTAGGVISSEQTRHMLPGTERVAAADGKQKLQVPEGVPSRPPKETLEKIQSRQNEERLAKQTSYEAPADNRYQVGAVVNAAAVTSVPERQMMSTTIALPQNYQMPDLATVNTMQAAGHQQPNGQFPPQMSINAAQVVAPAGQTGTYTAPQQFVLPMATAHSYANVPQQPQMPNGAPANTLQTTQPIGIAPINVPRMNVGQMQQPYQQPVIGQPMQPYQQMPQMPAASQMPVQAGQSTAVNYPAAGQLGPR